MTGAGFPHSDTPGSTLRCQLPRLIAGSYVLHRLLMPRHPPCALCSLSHKHSTKTTSTQLIAHQAAQHNTKDQTTHTPPQTKGKARASIALHCFKRTNPQRPARQMLASTIQQPNTTPTNTPTPHTPRKRHATRETSAKEAHRQRRTPRPADQRSTDPCVIPQDPTVCHHHPQPEADQVPHPHHHPPKQATARAVLRTTTHQMILHRRFH